MLLLASPELAIGAVAGVAAVLADEVAATPAVPALTDGIAGIDPVDARLPARSQGFGGAADAVACIEKVATPNSKWRQAVARCTRCVHLMCALSPLKIKF